jgi:hypothetical protein
MRTIPRSAASLIALLALAANPAGAWADDLLLHPLCLDNLGLHAFAEADGTERALICDLDPGIEIQMTPEGWVLAARPDAPEGWSEGWIGYRVAGRFPQLWEDGMFYLFEVVSNTGGSGQFSSLWVLEQLSYRPSFWPWLAIGGGDRCNDGQLRGMDLSVDRLVYTQAATPFRLLNPTDQTNERFARLVRGLGGTDEVAPSTLMNWRAYDDIPNCAICCVGEVVNEVDLNTGEARVTGLHVSPSRWADGFFDEDRLKDCSTEWVNGLAITNATEESAYVPLDAWLEMLEDLGTRCADLRQDP